MMLEEIAEIFMMLFFIFWSGFICFCAVKGIKLYDQKVAKHEEEVERLEKKLEAIRRGDWKK